MREGSKRNWANEYQAFLSAREVSPPAGLSQGLLAKIGGLLNPSPWLVFIKVSLIHAGVGLLGLLACPQMGVSLTGDEDAGLAHLFMSLGDVGCQFACGGFFLGSSLLAISWVLSAEELRVLRRFGGRQLAALSGISLLVLIGAGAEASLGLSLIWLSGAILCGIASLELGWRLRLARMPG
ncbi:MAG: hypothetical protein NDJ89_17555 [Oligoflexia bacterium]|nr:hypothetical protein [Oligoflexia bacterium]